MTLAERRRGFVDVHSFSFAATRGEALLRLLSTTDLHVHVFPFDYFTDRPTEAAGLARTAVLVAAMRSAAPNSLLFDNGDFLQGSALGDYIAMERGLSRDRLHPMIAAMNRMGYDAATLGNHEFNYGVDFLLAALSMAAFPVVSANMVTKKGATPGQDKTLVPPYRLLDRTLICADGQARAIRIGVIGFLPPQTALWDRDALRGRAETRDIVESARAWVPQMRAEGVDLVIALAHSGIGSVVPEAGMENAAAALAAATDVDAVIAGHSHLVFPSSQFEGLPGVDAKAGTLAGKPAVMAGSVGSHLGVIDLLLEPHRAGWRIKTALSRAEPVAQGTQSEGRILAAAAVDHAATRHYMARPVGRTDAPLATHFALLAETRALRLICDAQAAYVRHHLDGTGCEGLPVLSAAAPFKVGGRGLSAQFTRIAAGPVSLRNIADLYCFPNVIRAVRATGAEIADWLERAAAAYRQVMPGVQGQPLFDPAFPSYNFDMIAGLSYRFDVSAATRYDRNGHLVNPAGGRLLDLRFEGNPVDPDAAFVLATNNYRIAQMIGSGVTSQVILGTEITNRALLLRHVEALGRIAPLGPPNWCIKLPEGASADFETGLDALDGAPALPGLEMETMGATATGLLRIRLRNPATAIPATR